MMVMMGAAGNLSGTQGIYMYYMHSHIYIRVYTYILGDAMRQTAQVASVLYMTRISVNGAVLVLAFAFFLIESNALRTGPQTGQTNVREN